MKRRDFITLLGCATAAARPLSVCTQPGIPVIGFLDSRSPNAMVSRLSSFHQGLKEAGYVEGENLSIIYRWAQNRIEELPALAADLIRRQVALVVTVGAPATVATRAATTTVPITFILSEDPVKYGIVSSLGRPGGNLTGVNFLSNELAAKRLQLLGELVPRATRVALLVNPAEVIRTQSTLQEVAVAARSLDLQVKVYEADTSEQIDAAFASIARDQQDALFVALTPFLNVRLVQLVLLAVFHRLPVTHGLREYCEAGGLMSYGSNLGEAYRQAAVYVGRILKGAIPAELPILQSSMVELVINVHAARLLGLTVPAALRATAQDLIE